MTEKEFLESYKKSRNKVKYIKEIVAGGFFSETEIERIINPPQKIPLGIRIEEPVSRIPLPKDELPKMVRIALEKRLEELETLIRDMEREREELKAYLLSYK